LESGVLSCSQWSFCQRIGIACANRGNVHLLYYEFDIDEVKKVIPAKSESGG
jgi:hypothetical protein